MAAKPQRKPRVSQGRKQPPMTRLKLLGPEKRKKIYQWAIELNQRDALTKIDAEFGIRLGSPSLLTRFTTWQFFQEHWENFEPTAEEVAKLIKQIPSGSREQIREAGIALMMAKALSAGDTDVFESFAYLSIRDETAKAKAELEALKLGLSERRVKLLERKADALDKAKGLAGNKGLTDKEYRKRMDSILGI